MAARASRTALRTLAVALLATSALSFHLPARGIPGLQLAGRSRDAAPASARVARFGAKSVRGASFRMCAAVEKDVAKETVEKDLLADAYEVLNVAGIGFAETGRLLEQAKLATAPSGALLVEEGKDITFPSKERQVFLILSGFPPRFCPCVPKDRKHGWVKHKWSNPSSSLLLYSRYRS